MARHLQASPDAVFLVAGTYDPFVRPESAYLLEALLGLTNRERRAIVRQVVLLCGAIDGLEPIGALELLAQLGLMLERGGLVRLPRYIATNKRKTKNIAR